MSTKIKRKTGLAGSGSPITILINGEEVGKIRHKQEITLEDIHKGDHLQISQLFNKSKKIELNGNETIKISTPKLASFSVILAILLIPLVNWMIPSNTFVLMIFMLVLTFVIAYTLIKPQFHIEVVNTE